LFFYLRGIHSDILRRQERSPEVVCRQVTGICVTIPESKVLVFITLTLPDISNHPFFYIKLSFFILTRFLWIFLKMNENFPSLSGNLHIFPDHGPLFSPCGITAYAIVRAVRGGLS